MMTQEQNEKVQTIVRETIAKRFSSDEFVFDPIVVVPMVDEFGSDASGETYLRIIIVFDGDQNRLRLQLDIQLHQAHSPEVD